MPRRSLDDAFRMLGLVLRDPKAGLGRVRSKLDIRREKRAWRTLGQRPSEFYVAHAEAHARLHELLDLPWPCPVHDEFPALADEIAGYLDSLAGEAGVRKMEFAAQSDQLRRRFDADLSLARAVWCVVRHARPEKVVETGVARGITSRVILEAFERTGTGNLWSIDLPHAATTRFDQLGSAVPADLRDRWTLLLGSSRHHLPRVLDDLQRIDVFVHDSLHTARNVLFEFRRVWRMLRPGGIILADDVDDSFGFHQFVEGTSSSRWVVGEHSDGGGLWGAIVKH